MQEFQATGVTIIVVSHSHDTIREFCGRAILLDHGHLLEDGSPEPVIRRYWEVAHHEEVAAEAARLTALRPVDGR